MPLNRVTGKPEQNSLIRRYLGTAAALILVASLAPSRLSHSAQRAALALVDNAQQTSPTQNSSSTHQDSQGRIEPKLVWISLDALHLGNLQPYMKYITEPHARGLVSLLKSSEGQPGFHVGYPSITAPSHISTMTCTRSGTHGVFFNGGNWNGSQDLPGFAMPLKAETWVQALRREGKKVAVAAYPSVDGSSPERSADLGVAYDTPTGKVQYVKLTPPAEGQTTVVKVEVLSHQEAGAKLSFNVVLDGTQSVRVSPVEWANPSTVLPVGRTVDFFGSDGQDAKKRKAAVTFMNLGQQQGQVVVAVSPVSVMPVSGPALQRVLDDKNIVWSNIRDYGFSNYEGYLDFVLESLRHRRHAEVRAIYEMVRMKQADAFFLYFEDIDVLMHAFIGVKSAEEKIGRYLAEFDQELGQLLSRFPQNTNVVVLGDHGMSAIQYELNVRAMLPKEILSKFQVRVSGGALALYPPADLAADPDFDLDGVVSMLKGQIVEFDSARPVFTKVLSRYSPEAARLGLGTKISPWIMAFADDGIGLQNKMEDTFLVSRRDTFKISPEWQSTFPDPMNSGRLVQPTPLGAHGHDSNLDSMRTFLYLHGPAFKDFDRTSLSTTTDLVPNVARQLQWPAPAACR
jgi:predicted AlkP superfamily pyrophosphatase or phosphodiesterase